MDKVLSYYKKNAYLPSSKFWDDEREYSAIHLEISIL